MATVAIAACTTGTAAAAAPQQDTATCRDVQAHVHLGLVPATMAGTLCVPQGGADTIQVLVHGATYTRSYWDAPVDGGRYSYVNHANRAGYATLAIDRVGAGKSTHVLSAASTADAQASTVHQMIQKVRSGAFGASFDNVVLVGHSLGSIITAIEAARWHDTDAVILTGYATALDIKGVVHVFAGNMLPAILFGFGRDPGWLTTRPGTVADLFHNTGNVNHDVIEWDEANRSVVSAVALLDGIPIGMNPLTTRQITAPVLMENGTQDGLFCGGLTGSDCSTSRGLHRSQAASFTGAASFDTWVLPKGGHDIALAANAQQFYRHSNQWLNQKGFS